MRWTHRLHLLLALLTGWSLAWWVLLDAQPADCPEPGPTPQHRALIGAASPSMLTTEPLERP